MGSCGVMGKITHTRAVFWTNIDTWWCKCTCPKQIHWECLLLANRKKELLSSHFYSTLSHLKLYILGPFSNQHLSNRESRSSLTDATRKDTWLVWLCDFWGALLFTQEEKHTVQLKFHHRKQKRRCLQQLESENTKGTRHPHAKTESRHFMLEEVG